MLDMRTLVSLNIAYSLTFGMAILFFGRNRKYTSGMLYLGLGVITTGIGFLLIGFRDYLTMFTTVIIANMLILVGIMAILSGITVFTKRKVRWFIQHVTLFILALSGFLFYIYATESVNARIMITSLIHILYFAEIILMLFKRTDEEVRHVIFAIATFFFVALIIMALRIGSLYYQAPIGSFMHAGLIHSVSVIIYQLMPFVLLAGTFWISNIRMENELENQAMTDSLTGLYNRHAFYDLAVKEIHRANRHHIRIGLIIGDIDHFKKVNDNYGHLAGDAVLKNIACQLVHSVRYEDVVCRYGGEEFMLLVPQVGKDELMAICEKLRLNIEGLQTSYDGDHIACTMSFGATIITDQCHNLNDAIATADIALYEAKDHGRNKTWYCENYCHEGAEDGILR